MDTSIVSATDVEHVRDVVHQITSHPSTRKEARATVLLRKYDRVLAERKKSTLAKTLPSRFPGVDYDYRGQNSQESFNRGRKVIDIKHRRKIKHMSKVAASLGELREPKSSRVGSGYYDSSGDSGFYNYESGSFTSSVNSSFTNRDSFRVGIRMSSARNYRSKVSLNETLDKLYEL
jgi:hypothetical protein